jgi:hypothetical protein
MGSDHPNIFPPEKSFPIGREPKLRQLSALFGRFQPVSGAIKFFGKMNPNPLGVGVHFDKRAAV